MSWFCFQVDFIPWILFKTYTSIPFVEELRVGCQK